MFGLSFRQWFILLLLVVVLYAAAQIVPAFVDAFQFNDFIKQEVKFAVPNRRTSDALRAKIIERAQEYNITLQAKDILITRRGPAFTLEFDYIIPIDLRVYQRNLNFHVSENGELFDQ